ncbi:MULTISPECIES: DUF397 domain-containing protein [unclassified Solwaraspora]|uniref:DUF397 domain-containing protein n=1 Tax=unclassified Solwaraspora TaxID=2627926 RepID=UPI00259B808E|nr:DUF397 domain-containing protein [Solwaraspora sp. WMMA2056]WJK39456.1 DUF397 domain-containing protein [Solwaraspora sp. WMMA2056]
MDISTAPRWHKSTHSDSTSCVEVAENLPGRVLVRDTKDRDGGTLAFAPTAWSAFLSATRSDPTGRSTR